jgi:hypothetical protein
MSISKIPRPYRQVASQSLYAKAIIQMIVGAVAAAMTIARALIALGDHESLQVIQETVLGTIGVGLAVAAAIELAYTLFTHGPDEALDPVMLAVSAALILQLGKVDKFQWQDALAALLYIGVLGGLFAVRKYLADKEDPDEEALK